MNIRWVQACIALNEQNEAVGVLYMGSKAKVYPSKQEPTQAPQMPQTLPVIRQTKHPPSREEVRRAYGQ